MAKRVQDMKATTVRRRTALAETKCCGAEETLSRDCEGNE